jgi:hypothetical protein
LRGSAWDDLFENLVSFCEQHDIEIPDMIASYEVVAGCFLLTKRLYYS